MDNFEVKPSPQTKKAAPINERPRSSSPSSNIPGASYVGLKMAHHKWAVGFLALLVFLGVLWYWNVPPFDFLKEAGGYQAVFLTNGQVYFCKLSRQNSKFPVLRDVFYLQVTQPSSQIRPGELPSTNINLVKLGSELHAPTDEMRINSSQILFIEDLQSSSGVLKAIQNFAR